MTRKISVLLSVLGLIGCSSAGVSVVDTAKPVDTLEMNAIRLSEELLMPTRMMASCGHVVIYQRKGDDVFVLVNVSDGGKCSVIGRKGRGPNEFVGVDVQSLQPVENGFVCMDAGGRIR